VRFLFEIFQFGGKNTCLPFFSIAVIFDQFQLKISAELVGLQAWCVNKYNPELVIGILRLNDVKVTAFSSRVDLKTFVFVPSFEFCLRPRCPRCRH
jgi:hypothetical protein